MRFDSSGYEGARVNTNQQIHPRLTSTTLRGVWAAVPMPWDEKFRFDERAYEQNIRRTITAGVHGVYTSGSTGEFYAIDEQEFAQMVDIQAELCGRANMPLQIGCCADSTSKIIRLIEKAHRPEVGGVQVVLPYWMELTDREVVQFFADLHDAYPDMPLVHYNIPRAKRFLGGSDYRRILDVAPTLIGVKFTYAGTHFAQLQSSIIATPELSYFVGENLLVSAMQFGARGTYSSLIFTNPSIILDAYVAAAAGQWEQAMKLQDRIVRFLNESEAFIEAIGDGLHDPVFDKGLAVASGFLKGHQRCRPPYLSWSDATVRRLRAWLEQNHPDFLYRERSSVTDSTTT
jgi:dihydrodipicolinate synthase/N-acetylneuraminate lyase